MEKTSLLKLNSDYIANTFVTSILQRLLNEAIPIQKLRTVLDLLGNCSSEHRSKAYNQILDVFTRLCNEDLPKHQTPENIILRSKLNIDAFPFDEFDSSSEKGQELQTHSAMA